jgi:protein TonB
VRQDHHDEGDARSSAENADTDTAPLFDAAYLHNPAPDYPPMALQRRWEGTVLLNVHVLPNGSAREITVIASSGHESLDDAAREAVAEWRFVPARRAGRTTDAWVHVPVIFKAA